MRGLKISVLPSLTLVSPISLRSHRLYSVHKVWYVVLVVYIDDILLTGSALGGLLETKEHLKRHFVTKDMRPKYFLRIEIVHQKHSILFSTKVCSGSF